MRYAANRATHMKSSSSVTIQRNNIQGFAFGLLGVTGFSFTLPATRLAVAALDPVFVGLGRAVIAACLAAVLLLLTKQSLPSKRQWCGLAVVAAGVIIGFPTLTAWAMKRVPASHGAVILGLLPLVTAIIGSIRTREKPSLLFWLAGCLGSATVIAYALASGGGQFHPADFALFGAILCAALGYSEGAHLAHELGGWQVICWALIFAAPFLIWPVAFEILRHGLHATGSAWFGFAYVSVISMFLAFFAWYRGLATGGVARISQLQLLQPFMTLGFAAIFLHEHFGLHAVLAAGIVLCSIFISHQSAITSRNLEASSE